MSGAAQRVDVYRVACNGPADLRQVEALVDEGVIDPETIVAVMGKTEGNGCVNDFTRELATGAWCRFLAEHLRCTPEEVGANVAFVMSGGTEGALSPHFTIFTRRNVDEAADGPAPAEKRLVVGIAHSRGFQPAEIGRMAQVELTATVVAAAMRDAGIEGEADVHFVQVKCPLLTSAKVQEALRRGTPPVCRDTYESMAYSRGASALGVALALNEVERAALSDAAVLSDYSLHSSRASASAGIELDGCIVVVLGEATGSRSPFRIAHTEMRDAIDAASVRAMLENAFGLHPERDAAAIKARLVNVLAKAESSPDGMIRGARHIMLDDSDINATRHARAVVGGVLASVFGDTALYVSGGAEHQGPPGGGPVAAILRVDGAAGP